jgi:replicative DNA helicase
MKAAEFERIIIKALYVNKEVRSKVLPYLDNKWFFDVDNKIIVDKILKFTSSFNTMPTVIETKRMIDDDQTCGVFDLIMAIKDEDVMTEYILSEIEEFVKRKLIYRACEGGMKYVTTGEKINGSIADEMAEAEAFTFNANLGFDFFNDPDRLYEDANTKERLWNTGVKAINDILVGGIHEKSLNLFMAPTNIGKTLIMCSLATNMIMNGNSVLYLTFEDPENKIAARIAQNMFSVTQQEFKTMSRENFYKAFSGITNKIKSRLMIREMPEYSVNALHVNAYLKDLKEKKQFVPDVVFIDYIGCMIPNGKPNANLNTNTTLQLVAAQTRALAQVHGFPIISGLQANRGGNGIAELSLSDVADSFASTMKADAIFGVTQPDEFQQQNVYCMKLLKTRYGGKNRGATFLVGVDTEKQRIYDVAQDKVANDTVNIFDSQPISKNDGSVELDEIDYL